MRVGNCQATTVPGRTPMPYRPAATRSERSRNPPKLSARSSWRKTGRSGVNSARRTTSSQKVREELRECGVSFMVPLLG